MLSSGSRFKLKMRLNTNQSLGVISFLIAPVISLYLAIKNFKAPWAKNLVWAFTAFYAYHFIPPNEGADIREYIAQFNHYIYQDFSLKSLFALQYSEGSSRLDILEPLLAYMLSRVTTNYKILLLFYGIIYGFFYSRNIWYILDELKGKIKLPAFFILSLLLMTIGLWYMNGFRFWCAAHMYIYATYRFVFLKRNKAVFLLLISPLMHIGMALPVLVSLIFRFIKIPVKTIFILFLLTAFVTELNWAFINDTMIAFIPGIFQPKLIQYTSDAYIQSVNNRLATYGVFYHLSRIMALYFTVLFAVVLYVNRSMFINTGLYQVFIFLLFFGIFSNLLSQMPSGDRYSSITTFFLLGSMMIFFQNYRYFKLKRILAVSLPFCLLLALYQFRIIGLQTFSIHHLINNPVISIFIY